MSYPVFHHYELYETDWEVPEKYIDLIPLRCGSYGSICSSLNTDHNMSMAVKKLSKPFQSAIQAKRTFRELRLLKHMRHENIAELLEVFTPAKNIENFTDMYVVTSLMGCDLNQIIQSQILTDDRVQFLVYQVICGLKYIHSAGVIHGGLKPSNIVVNTYFELKILDSGLARYADDELTEYVTTRWYRAPEIMYNWVHYTEIVDIWSVGCIMAELFTGKILFPGSDNIDQLKLIFNLCGTPRIDFFDKMISPSAHHFMESVPVNSKKDYTDVFVGVSPEAVDLLERLLVIDMKERIKAAGVLQCAYLKKYHDPEDEPTAPLYDNSYEDAELDIDKWKELTFKEICDF